MRFWQTAGTHFMHSMREWQHRGSAWELRTEHWRRCCGCVSVTQKCCQPTHDCEQRPNNNQQSEWNGTQKTGCQWRQTSQKHLNLDFRHLCFTSSWQRLPLPLPRVGTLLLAAEFLSCRNLTCGAASRVVFQLQVHPYQEAEPAGA